MRRNKNNNDKFQSSGGASNLKTNTGSNDSSMEIMS